MIMSAVYIPLFPVLINADEVLKSVGVDDSVANYANSYMLPMIAGLYLGGLNDLVRRFLTCT